MFIFTLPNAVLAKMARRLRHQFEKAWVRWVSISWLWWCFLHCFAFPEWTDLSTRDFNPQEFCSTWILMLDAALKIIKLLYCFANLKIPLMVMSLLLKLIFELCLKILKPSISLKNEIIFLKILLFALFRYQKRSCDQVLTAFLSLLLHNLLGASQIESRHAHFCEHTPYANIHSSPWFWFQFYRFLFLFSIFHVYIRT